MKIIETFYQGILFRSRTEARWAVFMDRLGLKYYYEPEGFDLGEHGWYLPDFWLPDLNSFLEIKPPVVPIGRHSPTSALASHTNKNVYTMFGPPFIGNIDVDDCWENGCIDYPCGGGDFGYWVCVCPHCKVAGIEFNGRADRIGRCSCPKSEHRDKGYNSNDPHIVAAYSRAMSHKFMRPKQ